MAYGLFDHRLIHMGFCQHGNAGVTRIMGFVVKSQGFHTVTEMAYGTLTPIKYVYAAWLLIIVTIVLIKVKIVSYFTILRPYPNCVVVLILVPRDINHIRVPAGMDIPINRTIII